MTRINCHLAGIGMFCLLILPLNALADDHVPDGVEEVRTKMYLNENYGYAANFPRVMTICTNAPPGSNHGFVALLHASSCHAGLNEHPGSARIEFFADYDTLIFAKKTTDLARDACGPGKASRTALFSAGARVYACPLASDGPVRHQRYFFLHKSVCNESSVIFHADLYTSPENYQQDLADFKRLLKHVYWIGL